MSFLDILISALILGALALAVTFSSRANRERGGCGGDCGSCQCRCDLKNEEENQ